MISRPRNLLPFLVLPFLAACGQYGRAPFQLTGSGGSLTQMYQALSPALQRDARFVLSVSLGSEFEGGGNVARWTRSPTVSLLNATSSLQQSVQNAISQINGALSGSGARMTLVGANDESADILVIFAPKAQLPQTAAQFGVQYIPGNAGFFSTAIVNGSIEEAVVLVATDTSPTEVRHVILEELTQVMGPMRDQNFYRDSIFYEVPGVVSLPTQLSAIDARLLAFLYRFVRPGDDAAAVFQAFLQVWTTPVP